MSMDISVSCRLLIENYVMHVLLFISVAQIMWKVLKDRLKAYEHQGAEWIEKLPARTRMGYKLFEICPAIYGKLLSRMQEAG